jgi:flagellar biosynthesis GTPase FlhF
VSTLDFNNAVVLNGFRIPALTTRRTETEIELQNHQTFAVAGLINNNLISSVQKVPGLGDIPILGLLFRSKAAQKNLTELVVMITPEILPNNSPGVTPNLPRQMEPYLPPLSDKHTVPTPPAAFQGGARTGAVEPATQPTAAANGKPSAADSAALLKQQSPATRPLVQSPAPEPTEPAASQVATTSPNAAATASASRPASAAERKAAERASKEQRDRDALEARAAAEEAQRHEKQAEVDRRKQKEEDERLARVNRAQAQRDAELAKQAAEQAKKQAEIDKKHQKEIADAQNRLRAAQLKYQAELGK